MTDFLLLSYSPTCYYISTEAKHYPIYCDFVSVIWFNNQNDTM